MKLASLLGHTVTLEQPVSSLLFSFGPMVAALKDGISAPFHMGAFGGESPKPLKLVGTAAWLTVFRAVYLARKNAAAKPGGRLTKRSAGGHFTGKKAELEESSGYTRFFVVCMALCHLGWSADAICAELSRLGLCQRKEKQNYGRHAPSSYS